MPTLTFSGTLTYGDTTASGSVARREILSLTFTYTETSIKTVVVPASAVDSAIALDSVSAPKYVFVESLETDVTVKLSDGVVATPTPTSLKAASGWVLIANPDGQEINSLLVTTPASPTTGARVRILAFE